jgi:plasmid maintenance system antidote protein VapI
MPSNPIHPGEILKEELAAMEISAAGLAPPYGFRPIASARL